MSNSWVRACGLGLFVGLTMSAANADSGASSASSTASNLVGSLSNSLTGSSDSSSGDRKVAEGRYRVERMALAPGKPDHVRLHLQATDKAGMAGDVTLDLPRQAVQHQGLDVASLIDLRQRPYGMEVALATTQTAFFLLLADDWRGDLETRVVQL